MQRIDRRRAMLLAAVGASAWMSATAGAATVATWNGGTGFWSTASSWSGGVVPNNNGSTTYDVRIDGGKPVGSIVTLGATATVSLLTLDSGDRLNTSARSFVLASGGSATVNGLLSLDSGGQFLWNGPATLGGSGQLLWNGGLAAPNSTGSNAALTNNANMLGYGTYGVFAVGAVFVNNGYMENDSSAGVLTLRSRASTGVESTNNGTIRAAGSGGVVTVEGGTIHQYAGFTAYSGSIEANGGAGNATVNIRSGTTIIGGNVNAYQGSGATVNVESGAVISRDAAQGDNIFGNGSLFTSFGTTNINGGATLNGASFFVNLGGIVNFKNGATNFNNGNATLDSGVMNIGQGLVLELDTFTTGTFNQNAGGIVRFQNTDTSSQTVLTNVTLNAGTNGQGSVQIGAPAGTNGAGSPAGFAQLRLEGTLTNNANVEVFGATAGTPTNSKLILNNDVTLAGTGRITLDHSSAGLPNQIVALSGSQTLTNGVGHTIAGECNIGGTNASDRLRLINEGTIEADAGTISLFLNTGTSQNSGTLLSKGGMNLVNLSDFNLQNTGTIEALGATTNVYVGGAYGGTATHGAISGNGTWIADGGTIHVSGDIAFNTVGSLIARNGGTFESGGTSIGLSSLSIDSTSHLTALLATTLSASVANNGTFEGMPTTLAGKTFGSKLSIAGNVSGTGLFAGNLQLNATTNPGTAAGAPGTIGAEVLTLGLAHTEVADVVSAASFDRLQVSGEIALHGTVQPNFLGTTIPAYGTSLRLVSAGLVTGIFDHVANPQIDATHAFAITYDLTGVNAVIARPGDATLDGQVNFNDLLALAREYGKPNEIWQRGDFTGDGTTNFADLLILAKQYGQPATATADAVPPAIAADWALAQALAPEPSIACGVFLAACAAGRARRGRSRAMPVSG